MDKVLIVSMRNTMKKMENDVVKMGSGDSCNCRGSKGTLLKKKHLVRHSLQEAAAM